jgi:hypothetical protein
MMLKEKGLGWWMVACLWDTAFLVVMAPYKIARAATHAIMDPIELPNANAANNPDKGREDVQGQLEDQSAQLRHLSAALAAYEANVFHNNNTTPRPPGAPTLPPPRPRDGTGFDHRVHNPMAPYDVDRPRSHFVHPPRYGEGINLDTIVEDPRNNP